MLEMLKYEVAQDLGIELSKDYNGHQTTRDMGRLGGNMVRRLIQIGAEQMMHGMTPRMLQPSSILGTQPRFQ
jgi:hypothetical protein